MDLNDDFGAGLDSALDAPMIGVDTSGGGGTATLDDAGGYGSGGGSPNPFLSRARELWTGIPEDATEETIRDYVLDLQQQAARAQEIADRNKLYESELAQRLERERLAAEQQQTSQSQRQAAEQAEANRKYKAYQALDQSARQYLTDQFVELDKNGNYIPNEKFQFTDVVRDACRKMNEQVNSQRRLIEDFTSDPYAFGSEILRNAPELAEMRKEMEERFKKLEEREKAFNEQINPLQARMQQEALNDLIRQNAELLVEDKPNAQGEAQWSIAGDRFMFLTTPVDQGGAGMDPNLALQVVEPLRGYKKPTPKQKPNKPALNLGARMSGQNGFNGNNGGHRPSEVQARNPQRDGTPPWRQTLTQLGNAISTVDDD